MASASWTEALEHHENIKIQAKVLRFGVYLSPNEGPAGASFLILNQMSRRLPGLPPLTDEEKFVPVNCYRRSLGFSMGARTQYLALMVAIGIAMERKLTNVVIESNSPIMDEVTLRNVNLVPHLDEATREIYGYIMEQIRSRRFTFNFRRTVPMINIDLEIEENALEGSFMTTDEGLRDVCVFKDYCLFGSISIVRIGARLSYDSNNVTTGVAVALIFTQQDNNANYPPATRCYVEGLGSLVDPTVGMYRAFLLGLRKARAEGLEHVIVEGYCDSVQNKFEHETVNANHRLLRSWFGSLKFRRLLGVDAILEEQLRSGLNLDLNGSSLLINLIYYSLKCTSMQYKLKLLIIAFAEGEVQHGMLAP